MGMDSKTKALDYQAVRQIVADCFSRNGIEALSGEKVNPYLFTINVSRSLGETNVSRAFNETFHALGLLPTEVSLTPGDWSDYCGFFLDEESGTYLAMFNHPEAKQFAKGSEEYKFTLRGLYESETVRQDEVEVLIEGVKSGAIKSETLEGSMEMDANIYDATEMVDSTTIYDDFTKDNLMRAIGTTTFRISRGGGGTDDPAKQMRWTVEKVTFMDDSFTECDPFNVPEGFSPTSIAIHLGKRID